jgi:DegV family protein with EDD domain
MDSHRIALITDSTCDIPVHLREEYQINVVPLTIVWGERQYLDGVDMTPEAFYERLEQDSIHPTTSQPAPKAFLEAFQTAKAAGAAEVVAVTMSSAMSGTFESARQAAAMADFPVHVYDSKTNSMGLGWQVLAAARARQAGGDAQEMLAAADRARRTMVYFISLDTMEYLSRGGRIGGAVRFLDSVLRIKPQISVNHESGKVEAGIPARSRDKALQGIFKDFASRLDSHGRKHIAVLHNAAYAEAQRLVERVATELHPEELLTSIVSPILGTHTGPRAVALCGYSEE